MYIECICSFLFLIIMNYVPQKIMLDNIMEIKLQEVEQPVMGARNQTWNLWKSSKFFQLLNHLSSGSTSY